MLSYPDRNRKALSAMDLRDVS
eukprot:COSAG02_NODE_63229_length_263_cov_1.817073_1_plen_21_part_10